MFLSAALTAVLALFLAIAATGPVSRLGTVVSVGSIGCVLSALLLGPFAAFLWVVFLAVATAAVPPIAVEQTRGRRTWWTAHLLASVILVCALRVGNEGMLPLFLLLFGPGACVAAARPALPFLPARTA
ncbi:hypothetical protein ACE1OC_00630 [Streptomyces sp. DSM 116496]|uniref:hypothetical protein n=1 Tax=Streptomyces stoeckheimensis TaxID=3344656 RepID=UPI0038B39156